MATVITIERIRRIESDLNRLHARIYETLPYRANGGRQRGAWEDACRAFHAYSDRLSELESVEVLVQIRAGVQPWREAALLILEADPWFFRSGYVKGKIVRALKRVALTQEELRRVTAILLSVVASRDRREFVEYCRWAPRVPSPELRAGLTKAQESADRRTRSRATQMLSYLEEFS
jgi:hypothetical protein